MKLLLLAAFLFSSLTSLVCAEDEQPKEVQRLLKKIEGIADRLSLEKIFEHLELKENDLELEYGDVEMGAHDWVYALTVDKKWFLNIVWHSTSSEGATLVSYVGIYPAANYEHQHLKSRRPEPLKPTYRYTFPTPKPEQDAAPNP